VRYGAPAGSFEVGSNPEFLREGTGVTDFLYPDRIIVGSDDDRCTAILRQLYQPLTDGSYARLKGAIPIPDDAILPANLIVTATNSAELIKHAANAFLAMKVSFINAIANICEPAQADIEQVCEGMGADQRIGKRFMRPGIGYGGSCFPKDLAALRAVAHEFGYDFRLLEEVMRINEEQRQMFLRKVRRALWTLKGKRLAVLGLAFKGGTDDIRDSPAIAVIRMLLKERCEIVAYDPAAMERARKEFADAPISFAESAYEAAEKADALLILTDWEEFGALDFQRLRQALNHPILIDGRNLYSREEMEAQGFCYFSVGRQEAAPSISVSPQPEERELSDETEGRKAA
jgi:UDPglucose 6-dehydrogenase